MCSPDQPLHRNLPNPTRQSAVIEFRWRAIQEVIETQGRTSQRGDELRRAARKWGVSIRTLQRWMSQLQSTDYSVDALRPRRPKNSGLRRVCVSRVFDQAYLRLCGSDADQLHKLGEKVDQLIKAAWASPAQRAGWRQVRREVQTAFVRHLRENGIDLPSSAIFLSQRRIREARHFRIVDVRAHDRKTYDDHLPRIRRRNDLFKPMQQIVMDVKVVDCALRRADGTIAWPRMVAYMDTATQRVFCRFFLLKPSEGIRQEHVASTFLEMVNDPAWGFPQQLYRDNGSEFFIFDMIRTALDQLQDQKSPTIINARPYSAASKPIESRFAVIDRFVFSQMLGWTGGDRMRNKTATLGKPPAPYPGSFADFVQEAQVRMSVLEETPIASGPFEGRSPALLLNEHIKQGWRPLILPRERIDAAFCTRQTRRVSRGCVKINGAAFRHPALVTGTTVTVALPWRRGSMPLVLLPEAGWAQLEPDIAFAPNDVEGARESNKRKREHDAAVRRLQLQAGSIDLQANLRDRQATMSRPVYPLPIPDFDALADQKDLGLTLARSSERPAMKAAGHDERRRKETEDLEAFLASRRS